MEQNPKPLQGMEIITKHDRYVSEDIDALQSYGVVILETHLGAGKTTLLDKLKNKRLLYVTAKNQLIWQVCKRFTWLTPHTRDGKTYLKSQDLIGIERLAVNYHSLQKLSNDYIDTFDVMIVDETFAVFNSSATYNPNDNCEREFIHRIKTTPLVIFMGGHFPDFILQEIKTISSNRLNLLGTIPTKIEYRFPINRNVPVNFVYEAKHRDIHIHKQLALRKKRQEYLEDFVFATNEEEENEYNTLYNTKGVLITSEYGESINNIASKWQEAYPTLRIETVSSVNAHKKQELLETISDPNKYSDIDLLITSPSWCEGINIVNEFDLIVGDYARVSDCILTSEEIYQSLNRERNPKHIVIQISKYTPKRFDEYLESGIRANAYKPPTLDMHDNNFHEFRQAVIDSGFKIPDNEEIIRGHDGKLTWKNMSRSVLERYIHIMNDNFFDRGFRLNNTWNRFKKNGALVEKYEDVEARLTDKTREDLKDFYNTLPKGQVGLIKHQLTLASQEHNNLSLEYLEIIKEEMGLREDITKISEDTFNMFDRGQVKNNKVRNTWLDGLTKPAEPDATGVKLLLIIKRLGILMNKLTNETILTTEMFYKTPQGLAIIQDLKKNKKRYQTLFQSYKCFQEYPSLTKKEKDIEFLLWLEEVFRKYYILATFSKGGCKADYQKAKKECKGFEKWKKEYKASHKPKGNLRLEDYLIINLVDGDLTWNKLGTETKKYMQSFPHLKITHGQFSPVEGRA